MKILAVFLFAVLLAIPAYCNEVDDEFSDLDYIAERSADDEVADGNDNEIVDSESDDDDDDGDDFGNDESGDNLAEEDEEEAGEVSKRSKDEKEKGKNKGDRKNNRMTFWKNTKDCIEKSGIKPFENCKKCWEDCRASVDCSKEIRKDCRGICREDRETLRNTGCGKGGWNLLKSGFKDSFRELIHGNWKAKNKGKGVRGRQ